MTNQLYPAFFRLDRLQLLVVGAGEVGEEKLSFILKSSPNAQVVIVAPWMGEELKYLLEDYQRSFHAKFMARPQVQRKVEVAIPEPENIPQTPLADIEALIRASPDGQIDPKLIQGKDFMVHDTYYAFAQASGLGGLYFTKEGGSVIWLKREFLASDVEMADLVIAATNFREINEAVYDAAKQQRRLCNIADTPSLCDFYLGSIVTRGPLKIAISTNGQSPTFAKRFRQFLEAELPDFETTNLLDNLKLFRDRLTGDFQAKVRQLNAVTNSLLSSTKNAEADCRCPDGECLLKAAGKGTPVPDMRSASPSDK